MKLFTKDINQKLFAQYRIGSNLNNQKVVAKIFNPYGEGRWYLLNSDPNDPDYLWAIVQMGNEVEIGSVSRRELESVRIKPFGLPLERDIYFNERIAMEVLDGLEKGQTFAAGGMIPGRWYKDNSGKEFRYIGESQGKLLFNDGEKIIQKGEEDFDDAPKEKKLFGFFEEGGETEEGVDLFEDYDEIPDNVQEILQKYDFEEGDYRTLEKAKKDVETVGYTFEYSLDGTAYDLRKIGQKGKSEDEYAKGGEINWGQDLGDGFSIGNDVKITDTNSRFWNKYGYLVGKIGQRLVVRVGNDEMDAVVAKEDVKKLDAPMADGGEVDEEDSLDYNSISDLQAERNRLVRWKYQYNNKGADYKIKQLEERIEYLKSKDSKMADGGTTKRTVKLTLSDKDSYDYTYKQDGATASITFGFGKEPFQYEVKKISKSLEPLKQDILDAFTIQGIKQHEYKGGFSEAIKHLDTKVVYEDNMAKGGETKINLGVDKNGKSYKVGDIISLRAYMYEIMKDDDGKIILSQLDSYYAPFGKNFQVGSSQFNDILKEGVIFSNRGNKMAKGGETESYEVVLSAVPNIDYEEDRYEGSIKIKSKKKKVKSIEEAQSEVRKFIVDNELGGGNFNGGDVYKNGEKIGYVSYNGRFWDKTNMAKGGKVGDPISEEELKKLVERLSKKDKLDMQESYALSKAKYNLERINKGKMAEGGEVKSIRNYLDEKYGSYSDKKLTKEDIINIFKIDKDAYVNIFIGGRVTGPKSFGMKDVASYRVDGRLINLMIKKGELKKFKSVGKVWYYTLDFEKFNIEQKMADGGKVKFEDKVKAIKASLLKRKKVSPKVQKDYGKTYSPKEAEESAKRIAGALRAKYDLKKK